MDNQQTNQNGQDDLRICETIRELRRRRGVTQDALAQTMGVSVQAVSKWECESSIPDVSLLPKLAKYFGVTIDELFYGLSETAAAADEAPDVEAPEDVKDDGILRIIQFLGRRPLTAENYRYDKPISLRLDVFEGSGEKRAINLEVWGSAKVEGDIGGNCTAGEGIACGNVGGNCSAGDGVACGNIGGKCNAGDGVACGDIGGSCNAGDSVTCSCIGGSCAAGDSVNCGGDIGGSCSAGEDITCNNINNAGTITCDTLKVSGNVSCRRLDK